MKALKAAGSNLLVDEETFLEALRGMGEGLVVTARTGLFSVRYLYQTQHAGYTLIVKTRELLAIPAQFEIVTAEKIHNPVLVAVT